MTTPPEPDPVPPPDPADGIAPPPPPPPSMERPAPRRLTRSRSDRWLAGVAGGLAEYWDTDPTLIRVAMIAVTVLTGGVGLIGYIAAWILMPEGDTAAEPVGHGQPPRRRGRSNTGVVWGGIFIIGGLLVLLAQLDVETPDWNAVLAAVLILAGLGIVFEARRRAAGGLFVLAGLLTAVLAVSELSNFDLDFDGAFGDRNVRVSDPARLEDSYSHAFGSLSINLRDMALPQGTTRLEVDIAFGSVELLLPDDAAYRIDVETAFGNVETPEGEASGIGFSRVFESANYGSSGNRLEIDLSVGFGSGEVDLR